MMSGNRELLSELRGIVGRRHVIDSPAGLVRFTTGFRTGGGNALAAVCPGSLVEYWRVLQAIIAHDKIVIMQAANTGLTGGSTPNGDYDRDVVVISTLRMKGVIPIVGGQQVICLPGATLDELERRLVPLGREPHSVLGSSCIGASVHGGICNSSGGALLQRGPAYTELALYARLDATGQLELVNELGVFLGSEPETMLAMLDGKQLTDANIRHDKARGASDQDYAQHVRLVDAPSPARFNADPRRLRGAAGSAGRVALFAVRLDTFPAEPETRTFYLGASDPVFFTKMRRDVLSNFATLPISAEYIHRGAFDLADAYGKDIVLAIDRLGTAKLPLLFSMQRAVDRIARWMKVLPDPFSDRFLQALSRMLPDHLPARLRSFRDRFEHHLLVRVSGDSVAEMRTYLASLPSGVGSDYFECDEAEASKAFLHRFAVAGAAVRFRAVHPHEVEDVVSLDIALRRNDPDWADSLPDDLADQVLQRVDYGHFFCHVFHHDYILRRGVDAVAFKDELLVRLTERGAEYPAEHNVGHLYRAKSELEQHYRNLDPRNSFNPGIGKTSRSRDWK